MMGALAATAFVGYAAMTPAQSFWVLAPLNLIALTAQSALMPLGDTVTLAVSRSNGLDYGRFRVWGSNQLHPRLAGGWCCARLLFRRTGASARARCFCALANGMPMYSAAPSPDRGQPVRGCTRLRGRAQILDFCRRCFGAADKPSSLLAYYGQRVSSPKSCCSGWVSACSPGLGRSR